MLFEIIHLVRLCINCVCTEVFFQNSLYLDKKFTMATFEEEAFGVKVSDLYRPYNDGMGPAIDATVAAIKTLCPNARSILDLGSGHGEPGCTIAAAFPDAYVICSDLAPSMLRLAAQRAADRKLTNVGTKELDLCDLGAIEDGSQDVVTANFALQHAPDLVLSLREIFRVLKPGGVLVGTLWQEFSVPVVASEVFANVMGLPPPDTAAEKYSGSMRLADVDMVNGAFKSVDFTFADGHDSFSETSFNVGTLQEAWKHVLISQLADLQAAEGKGDTSIVERAQKGLEQVATARGYLQDGVVHMPGRFRNFRVTKDSDV